MKWMNDEGEKVHPPKYRRIPAWQWIVGAIVVWVLAAVIWSLLSAILGFILLVLGVAAGVIAISQVSVRKIVMPPRIFMLGGRPALVIRKPTGAIRIHTAVANSVRDVASQLLLGWFGMHGVEKHSFAR